MRPVPPFSIRPWESPSPRPTGLPPVLFKTWTAIPFGIEQESPQAVANHGQANRGTAATSRTPELHPGGISAVTHPPSLRRLQPRMPLSIPSPSITPHSKIILPLPRLLCIYPRRDDHQKRDRHSSPSPSKPPQATTAVDLEEMSHSHMSQPRPVPHTHIRQPYLNNLTL